jgi:gliding motility-associated-like protein
MVNQHRTRNTDFRITKSFFKIQYSVFLVHYYRRLLVLYLGFAISLAISLEAYPQAGFSIPDTICINESVTITNQSRNADTYYWNFCSGNLIHDPAGDNLANPGTLNEPAFIDFADDDGNYYAFITNHNDGTLVRNSYGTNFLNTPASQNLGGFGGLIPLHAQGIQVLQEGGNWHVFIVGGQREESRLIRLDFGTSLMNNAPVVTNLGNAGNYMDYPEDLYITYDAGNWTGFTVNYNSNNLVRFDFGNSLSNIPTLVNLGNLGFDKPCGIQPVMENGNWYIFVSNYGSHVITRLDFGSSLASVPSSTPIGDNTILYYPFDLTIIRDCENTYGFVLNRFNDIVRMVFNNGLDENPVYTSLGETGNLYNPQGISDVFRVGDTLYAFVANIDNSTITRLYFPGCNNASPPSSTDRDPPPVTYNAPGIYNINLVIDEGQPGQENACRNIVVLDSADMSLGNDTLITAGTSITLAPDSTYSSYLWSNGSTERTIQVDHEGVYTLTVTNQYGCVTTDDIEVIVDIGIPNFFTPNGDGYNDTWEIPFLTVEPEAGIQVFDRFGNLLAGFKAGEGSWDGRSHGREMPTGTYWYIIEVPGISKPYKGWVTIKR